VHHPPQQPQPAPRPFVAAGPEPHTAPHDEIVAVIRDLARSRGTVTLDSLANALKARGFSRPPGSPRLITRLRRIKEIEVNRAGVITLVGGSEATPTPAPVESEAPVEAVADAFEPITPDVEDAAPSHSPEPPQDTGEADVETEGEPPDPLNREGAHLQTTGGGGDAGRRRRRSRRGGRRRRGRGGEGRDGGGRPGGGGGGTPPGDRDTGPRGTGADRARDVASRYAPRDVAPSWISGQPLA
jgi:hypothetical protein